MITNSPLSSVVTGGCYFQSIFAGFVIDLENTQSSIAGWTVLAGIRVVILKWKGKSAETPMTIMAAGFIAGDALYSFFTSVFKIGK